MGSFFGIEGGAGQSATDQLVAAYRQTKKPQVDSIKSRTSQLEARRSFFVTFNSRLNTLVSQLDKFDINNASEKFVTRKAESSNTDIFTASANSKASLGSNNIKVNRLASQDILVSGRLNNDDAYGVAAGTYSFTLNTGENSASVEFTLDGTETNQEALTKIAKAINDNEESGVNASFIRDTSSTGRLSLVADESGAGNSITVTGSSAIDALGIKSDQLTVDPAARTVASNTSAGYIKSDTDKLSAKLEINGINVTRDSNTIDDLLTGITLNLKKAQEADESAVALNTEIDTDSVKELISPLLKAYNDTLKHLGSSKTVRRSDPSVSTMQSRLRGIPTQAVSTAATGNPKYLLDAGIEVNDDGTLSLTDTDRLEELLKDDPQKVAGLFVSEDGFVNKIKSAIEGLTGSEGLIQSRRDSLTDQIDHNNERVKEVQARIDQEAENMRQQYTNYLESYYEAQGQYSLLNTMSVSSSGGGSGYDSLLAQQYGV